MMDDFELVCFSQWKVDTVTAQQIPAECILTEEATALQRKLHQNFKITFEFIFFKESNGFYWLSKD